MPLPMMPMRRDERGEIRFLRERDCGRDRSKWCMIEVEAKVLFTCLSVPTIV